MKRLPTPLIALLAMSMLSSCLARRESPLLLKSGIWRATLELQGQQLPFNLEVYKNKADGYEMFIRNAEEKILLDEISVKGDSVDITLHVFDASIKAKIEDNELTGEFIKNYDKTYRVPFRAYFGQAYRYAKGKDQTNVPDFTGKYGVTFVHDKDTTLAIAVFQQHGDSVTGTFLTPTGDYRFLQGNVVDGRMQLSAFDGNHSYIFYATKTSADKLVGEYYSGKTWKEAWFAVRSDNPVMPDAEKLTYLKPGFDKISFEFPDVNGKKTSLADDTYKNKVVILQIMGSWCPNCMDETNFLAPWYLKNKDRGVRIIGLAYERKPEFAYASERVKKMVTKLSIPYEVLIAGTNDKEKASETLPMLNAVFAFPTTIFIGKDGKVKRIHTGFTGPGTGKYYEEFMQHFDETVNELLNEKPKS